MQLQTFFIHACKCTVLFCFFILLCFYDYALHYVELSVCQEPNCTMFSSTAKIQQYSNSPHDRSKQESSVNQPGRYVDPYEQKISTPFLVYSKTPLSQVMRNTRASKRRLKNLPVKRIMELYSRKFGQVRWVYSLFHGYRYRMEAGPEGLPELNATSCTHNSTCIEMWSLPSTLRPYFLYSLILNHPSSISTSISLY